MLLTESSAVQTVEFDRHLAPLEELETVPAAAQAFSTPQLARMLARLRRRGVLVVVPRADRHLPAALLARLLARRPWRGHRTPRGRVRCLVMRPDIPPGWRPAMRLKAVVSRLLVTLGEPPLLLDDVVPGARMPRTLSGTWVRDPVLTPVEGLTKPDARRTLGVPTGPVTVGLVGLLNSRKNIGLVLDTWRALGDVTLLLVGKADDETRLLLDSARSRPAGRSSGAGRMVLVDDYVSDRELQTAILASDLLLLPYSNVGSSGLLGLAVALGTPVVAAGNPRVTAMVSRNGLGVCSELTAPALAEAIRMAVAEDCAIALARAGAGLRSGRAFAEQVLDLQA